jgi:hypothetical protein
MDTKEKTLKTNEKQAQFYNSREDHKNSATALWHR